MIHAYRVARHARSIGVAALCLALAACGGSGNPDTTATVTPAPTPPTPTYTVGGTLSGLESGTSVTLSNTVNHDAVAVSSNGTFTFPTALASGGTWNVVVNTQPTNQTCAVTNYQGSVTNADVTNIAVTCSPTTYTLNGAVTGALASGQSLNVLVNGSQQLTLTSSSSFSLGTVPAGSTYAVTLQSGWYGTDTATGVYCYVQNGSGTANADVSNIGIECGPAPATISLAGTQNTISYSGWVLSYPAVFNGELYYQVNQNGSVLNETMNDLQTLFNGSGAPAMNASGDPPVVATGSSTNATTLQATDIGGVTVTAPVTVAIPTLKQYDTMCIQESCTNGGDVPYWSYSADFWSSTADGPGMHFYLTMSSDSYSAGIADSTSDNVALQVQ